MNVIELSIQVLERSGPAAAGGTPADGGASAMAHSVGSEAFPGVMPDHAAALLVPLLVPLAIWAFFGVVELSARAGSSTARRLLCGYQCSSSLTRLTALLLVLAGAVHLALVPGHLEGDRPLAMAFALDGAAFLAVGIAAFVWDRWRRVAATLLGATLAAYLFYLGSGREGPDLVGTATYLVELVALGLIWIPRGSALAAGERHLAEARRGDELGVGQQSVMPVSGSPWARV